VSPLLFSLKENGVFDEFNQRHREAMQWHGTIWFLPMHRAMMKDFEDHLLQVSPDLGGLPYCTIYFVESGLDCDFTARFHANKKYFV
jgi:hypothetical protein